MKKYTKEWDREHWYHADGNTICRCGRRYSKHENALEEWNLDWNKEPFMKRLCDGYLVKL